METYIQQTAIRAKQLKDLVLGQGLTKIIFVGSAIAIISIAAYGFLKSNDGEDEGSKKDKKKGNDKNAREKSADGNLGKKKFMPEKKFFREEDAFSDEVSTSNQNDGRRTTRSARINPTRFMSESEGIESGIQIARDLERQVTEEADDLYFTIMKKIKPSPSN